MPRKLTYEFVKEQIEKEGYKLLSEEYVNNSTKLKVKCNKGHEYNITYDSWKRGNRCFRCFVKERGIKQRLSYEYVKEQIEKEGYKLLSEEYNGDRIKLKVKCNKGHEYKVKFSNFKNGCRCFKCFNNNRRHSYEYVKEQIEKEGYKLISKKYINAKEKIKVKCSNGHEYEVKYGDFYTGYRCPICSTKFSKSEKEIVEYLKSLNIDIIENDRSIISPFELDIVIPEKKIAIEYCGLYWHSEKFIDKNYHLNKLEKTKNTEYKLITIFEDEWIYKQEIVKNRLKYFLKLNTERIYARKCEIREINTNEARMFIDKYHIQGYVNASICLGAFYNGELVAVNTFIKRGMTYELNRFCSSCNVIGIASKLLKYFQRNYEYEKIITFADLRWSEGNLYEKIGFKKDKIIKPDYSYFSNRSTIRFHKFNFRHSGMKNKLENYNPELSEKENMLNNNYYRIYDCGKIKYVI